MSPRPGLSLPAVSTVTPGRLARGPSTPRSGRSPAGALRVGLAIGLLALAGTLPGRAAEAARQPGRGLQRAEAAVPGLTVSLSTNASTYLPGALHVLSASAASPVAVTVDVYVVIQLPSGEFFSLLASGGFSAGIVPYLAGVSLPAGFTFPLQTIFSGSIPPLPFGTFTWMGGFTTPGTLDVVSNLAPAIWTLTDQEPPPPPPLTPVVWVPDFLGARVAVRMGEGASTKALTLLLDPDGTDPCSPNSVAVNQGKLYVICTGPDAIRIYDAEAIKAAPAGPELTTPAQKRISNPGLPFNFDQLIGSAFDGQNNLWVANFGFNQLLQFSAESLASDEPAVTAALPNSPNSPVALTFDTDGSLWVVGHFDDGMVLNFAADQLDQGGNAVPRHCLSAGGACGSNAGLFKFAEGLAIFNGKIWVANNGGDTPGRELVALRVENDTLVVDGVFGDQAGGTGAVVCPGGLFATGQHLWVNDQGFSQPNTTCGATDEDQGSGVGAVLRFTGTQLDGQVTDPAQIVRFRDITSRPGFGGLFVEE